jgi:hypothetical protein
MIKLKASVTYALIVVMYFACAVLGVLSPAVVSADTAYPELISTDSSGLPQVGLSIDAKISSSGRYVAYLFNSDPQTSDGRDLYVYDRQAGTAQLVSVNNTGESQNGTIFNFLISGDGHHVAMQLSATNMGDNGEGNIYVRNLEDNTTKLVSQTVDGLPIGADYLSHISFDGNEVMFSKNDSQGSGGTFVTNVSTSSTTHIFQGALSAQNVSGDGQHFAYIDYTDQQAPSAVIFDRETGSTKLLDARPDGLHSESGVTTSVQDISDNGRYVLLRSDADDLLPGNPSSCVGGQCSRLYVRDTLLDVTVRVDVDSQQNDLLVGDQVGDAVMSGDGSKVIFLTYVGDTGILLRDLVNRTTYAVGYGVDGSSPDGYPYAPIDTSYDGTEFTELLSVSNFGAPAVCPHVSASRSSSPQAEQSLDQCVNTYVNTAQPRNVGDVVPPTVTGAPDRAANASGWYRAPVTINWTSSDPSPSSGTPTQPSPTAANIEGKHTYVSGQSCDPAGNCATGSLQLSIDTVKPTGTYTGNSFALRLLGQKITGSSADATSGVAKVEIVGSGNKTLSSATGQITLTCNAAKTSCTWSANPATLNFGLQTLTLKVTDIAGNVYTTTKLYTIF